MSESLPAPRNASQRGSVFILALAILTLLLILGASLIAYAYRGLQRTTVENRSAQSFHLAEAGAHKAIHQLSKGSGWLTYEGETGVDVPPGGFDVSVSPPAVERTTETALRITATGYLQGPEETQRLPKQIQVVVTRGTGWPFGYGLAAQTRVDVGDALVDSFRSRDGLYGGTNVHANATIAVNATSYGPSSGVEIESGGVLNGNILVGPDTGDPSSVTSIQGTHNGSVGTLGAPLPADPASIPAGITDLGDMSLSEASELSLLAGSYRLSSLTITGTNATLFVVGRTKLYVDGDIYIAGNGIVNLDPSRPRNFTIYGTENCTSVQIRGSRTLRGAVYAPHAAIIARGSETSDNVYGALVGDSVTLEGSQTRFHYDQSLDDSSDAPVVVKSWQEL